MTFHEAIAQVISKNNRPMTALEIALELSNTQLYSKKDGTDIKSSQVEARANSYPKLFSVHGSLIGLSSGDLLAGAAKPQGLVLSSADGQRNQLKLANPGLASKVLLNPKNSKLAKFADPIVPDLPGIYIVRIQNIHQLPKAFTLVLEERKHNLLYVGIASESLQKQFLAQELRGVGEGSFFRSLGAILGFLPPKGSLKSDSIKFSFSDAHRLKIIDWINANLRVNWVCLDDGWEQLEAQLILDERPLVNISKNPESLKTIKALREMCVETARASQD